MEGMKGLLHGKCLVERACGAWIEDKSEVAQGKQRESFCSLGPSTGTLEAQKHLKHQRRNLLHVCGDLAAAKSSLVQQVPGLING